MNNKQAIVATINDNIPLGRPARYDGGMRLVAIIAMAALIGLAPFGCEKPPAVGPSSTQLIEVRGEPDSFRAKLVCFERFGRGWDRVFECPATIGKNGLILSDDKREGDGKTPVGIFKLERAFGYAPRIETGLKYEPVSEVDIWIDDPDSPDYNLRVKKPTHAKSFEELYRMDQLYEFAAVIEYNTKTVKKGAGSAIFLHVWGGKDSPTAGCVAVEREKLISILKWLDNGKLPQIIIAFDAGKTSDR